MATQGFCGGCSKVWFWDADVPLEGMRCPECGGKLESDNTPRRDEYLKPL